MQRTNLKDPETRAMILLESWEATERYLKKRCFLHSPLAAPDSLFTLLYSASWPSRLTTMNFPNESPLSFDLYMDSAIGGTNWRSEDGRRVESEWQWACFSPCRGEGWHWLCFTSDSSIIRAHIFVVTALCSPWPFKSKNSNVLLLVISLICLSLVLFFYCALTFFNHPL